ncbi:ABC-type multidrug transport system, permease component [Euzebya pacifica]|uniref:ABC-type multidrug transport system, permease component n=1 Tax=Euzebya pacifica TaxID=1608957 RepID=A0A346Y1K8_9ACTN|nr:ABC transporter permease [Euzebya pacifica]AXV08355.1 ABC-type multidrug transport system, permease component [Euzebya pacifica]
MKDLMGRLRLSLRRIGGVSRKELVELVRQPAMLFVLVVGPLLILLLFGSGVRAEDPAVRSIFVTPPGDEQLAEVVRGYADSQSERLTILDVTDDREDAMRELRGRRVDVVVVFPENPIEAVEQNDRATIEVIHSFIDPLESQAIRLFTRGAVSDLNDILLSRAVEEAQTQAATTLEEVEGLRETLDGPAGSVLMAQSDTDPEDLAIVLDDASIELEQLIEIDPDVVAAPLDGRASSIGGRVTTSQFYAPAVVALILQHLTLTFVALARSRERELGTVELFGVSPLREVERIAGQAVAYVLSGSALAAVLLAAVSLLLGAPFRAGVGTVALVVVAELLASIGVGLLLSRVARTTTQVVQGAMLILLLSVFFGGLLLSPERLLPWAQPIGDVLPMSHALELLRDSMLRGLPLAAGPIATLVGMAVDTIAIGSWLAIREEHRG